MGVLRINHIHTMSLFPLALLPKKKMDREEGKEGEKRMEKGKRGERKEGTRREWGGGRGEREDECVSKGA